MHEWIWVYHLTVAGNCHQWQNHWKVKDIYKYVSVLKQGGVEVISKILGAFEI